MVELTLELYFSVLDEDAEWPAVLRGERVVGTREENLRSCSKSDKGERPITPELKEMSESRRENSFSNSRSRVERLPCPAERLAWGGQMSDTKVEMNAGIFKYSTPFKFGTL